MTESIKLYRQYNVALRTTDKANFAAIEKNMNDKAAALRSYLSDLTKEDALTQYIDIPVEIYDFRADGEVFTLNGSAGRKLRVSSVLPSVDPQKIVLDYGKKVSIPVDAIAEQIYTDTFVTVTSLSGHSYGGYNFDQAESGYRATRATRLTFQSTMKTGRSALMLPPADLTTTPATTARGLPQRQPTASTLPTPKEPIRHCATIRPMHSLFKSVLRWKAALSQTAVLSLRDRHFGGRGNLKSSYFLHFR